MSSTPCWELPICRRWHVFVLVASATILSVAFAAKTLQVTVAASLGDTLDSTPRAMRAAELDPSNPEWQYILGTLEFANGGDSTLALMHLRRATELSPATARFWVPLGRACFVAGDMACADRSTMQASDLAPSKPRYAWDAALYFSVTDRPDQALRYSRRYLRLQPNDARNVSSMLYRTAKDADRIWSELISDQGPQVKLAFLDVLVEDNQIQPVRKYWGEFTSGHTAIGVEEAKPLIERLLSKGYVSDAFAIWQYLQETGSIARSDQSLLYNGDFRQKPVNAGFDWRWQPRPYVSLTFERGEPNAPGLVIEYSVPDNSESEPLYQYVPVIPGKRYELSATIRSEQITSDSGPRLRIVDATCRECMEVMGEGVTGTTPWHQVSVSFTAPPETRLVRVSVWRPRSRTFPTEISGRVFVDRLTLIAAEIGRHS